MAARRPSSVCLFCQSRKSLIGRRRLTTTAKRRLETAAVAHQQDDGFIWENSSKRDSEKKERDFNESKSHSEDSNHPWKVESQDDELREAMLSFEALHKSRDTRIKVLRSLSNPWPDRPQTDYHNAGHIPRSQLSPIELPEAGAALIDHATFRIILAQARQSLNDKLIRKTIRSQLLRCEWPRDILRIVAASMQHKLTAQNFALQYQSISRAIYRSRNNVSDPEILRLINVIIQRLTMANLHVDPTLLWLGLRFGARARSLPCTKKYLQRIRDDNIGMTPYVFRSIIAKFSIGHRGLGEIRNGRWQRQQLLQVLKGFDDAKHLPPEKQYHLGSFLEREDWQYLHGWVAVLARCRDSEGVWGEWERWKQTPARTAPKVLARQASSMTSRKRGDYWFVEQMTMSGDLGKAWQIVKESELPFSTFHDRVKSRLLEGVEFATVWDEEVREAMVQKYDIDLRKIESALGVTWVGGGEEGEGRHELVGDQEEALEKLSAEDFKLEQDFGFPIEGEAVLQETGERALHDAEERGLALQEGDGK